MGCLLWPSTAEHSRVFFCSTTLGRGACHTSGGVLPVSWLPHQCRQCRATCAVYRTPCLAYLAFENWLISGSQLLLAPFMIHEQLTVLPVLAGQQGGWLLRAAALWQQGMRHLMLPCSTSLQRSSPPPSRVWSGPPNVPVAAFRSFRDSLSQPVMEAPLMAAGASIGLVAGQQIQPWGPRLIHMAGSLVQISQAW